MAGPVVPTPTPDDSDLPAELRGKSAKEIAEHFAARERDLQNRLDNALRVQPAPEPKAQDPGVTTVDFWNDPKKAVQALAVSREEFSNSTQFVQKQLIEMAPIIAGKRHDDWNQWEPKIKQVMSNMAAWQQADPDQWDTAYTYVKGMAYDDGIKSAYQQGRMPSEPVRPAASAPAPKKDLTGEERYVCDHLGISEETYRKGQQNLQEGKWPLTMSNIKQL